MIGDDTIEALLRRVDEKRREMVDRISHGGAPADNVQGGYRECAGYVRGLDDAEAMIREVFRAWLPEPIRAIEPKPRSGIPDY